MKICIDSRIIVNHKTGVGNYTYNLIHSLLEIDQKNDYLIFVNETLDKHHDIFSLNQKNLEIKVLNVAPVSLRQQYALNKILKQEKIDIYHYPNWDLPLFQNSKSIFTIHDLTYLLHNAYVGFGITKKTYTWLNIYFGLKKAKKIIAVSESTKKDIIRKFKIEENKIKVIYESCDSCFVPVRNIENNYKDKTDELNNQKYFLFVGEMRPHKNLNRIISGFSNFKAKHKDFKLIVVGKNYRNFDDFSTQANSLGLKEDVIFYGHTGTDELVRLYQNAEALLFISIYEGFGIPILEAMSCGIPVITSSISAMAEIAGNAAITVDPYNVDSISDAMKKIVGNRELRSEYIKKGYIKRKNFNWKTTAEQTLKIYEEVHRH